MSNLPQFALAFAIIAAASFVQGATAFGFALVAVPLLLLLMPPVEAVSTSLVLACAVNLLMIRDERQAIAWREVMLLMPGAAAGAVVGMLFLRSFDGPLFKLFIAGTFLMMALFMLAGRTTVFRGNAVTRNAVAAASGVLMGSTSMGGPPVVLYLTGRGFPRSELRGTLAMFFLLGNIAALLAFLVGGMINTVLAPGWLLLSLALFPGYAAGRALTSRLGGRSFRRLVLVSMAVIAFAEVALNTAAL